MRARLSKPSPLVTKWLMVSVCVAGTVCVLIVNVAPPSSGEVEMGAPGETVHLRAVMPLFIGSRLGVASMIAVWLLYSWVGRPASKSASGRSPTTKAAIAGALTRPTRSVTCSDTMTSAGGTGSPIVGPHATPESFGEMRTGPPSARREIPVSTLHV